MFERIDCIGSIITFAMTEHETGCRIAYWPDESTLVLLPGNAVGLCQMLVGRSGMHLSAQHNMRLVMRFVTGDFNDNHVVNAEHGHMLIMRITPNPSMSFGSVRNIIGNGTRN